MKLIKFLFPYLYLKYCDPSKEVIIRIYAIEGLVKIRKVQGLKSTYHSFNWNSIKKYPHNMNDLEFRRSCFTMNGEYVDIIGSRAYLIKEMKSYDNQCGFIKLVIQ